MLNIYVNYILLSLVMFYNSIFNIIKCLHVIEKKYMYILEKPTKLSVRYMRSSPPPPPQSKHYFHLFSSISCAQKATSVY